MSTAADDLKDAINSYNWAVTYCRGSLSTASWKKKVGEVFFKIRGFMPAESYFEALRTTGFDDAAALSECARKLTEVEG